MPAAQKILAHLNTLSNPVSVAGMRRFGISGKNMLGVSVTTLRKIARTVPKNHALAKKLWKSGIHEARILASMLDEPDKVTSAQMDAWIRDFDSWDVCDQVCGNLFDKTPVAWKKAESWTLRKREFEKRAGFALMATLAWHEKKGKITRNGKPTESDAATDKKFEAFFPFIIRHATDKRNFVKKAANWALRQIGKRNPKLREKAIRTAKQILRAHPDSKSARFVATDALRELEGKPETRKKSRKRPANQRH